MSKLFESIGKETISKEYKEFSFKIDIEKYYSLQEVNEIVKFGHLDHSFNRLITDNLKHYSKYYIPKYISGFCNGDDTDKYSTLYFGVDDYGEITGIPYIGELPKDEIILYIKKCIKDYIVTTDSCKNHILKNTNILIEKLEVNEDLAYSDISTIIQKIEDEYNIYKLQHEKYIKIYEDWYKKLSKYSTKLLTIHNTQETRDELKEYILDKSPEHIHVVSQDITMMLENVEHYKTSPDNYLYWLCKFRDQRIDELIRLKPIKPIMRMKYINYSSEFIKLERLRKVFIENNKDIHYYLIKIEIPNNLQDEVFYKDTFGGIKKKIRTLDNDGEPFLR